MKHYVLAASQRDFVYCCVYVLGVNPRNPNYKYVVRPETLWGAGPNCKIFWYETFWDHPKRHAIQLEIERLQFIHDVPVERIYSSKSQEQLIRERDEWLKTRTDSFRSS